MEVAEFDAVLNQFSCSGGEVISALTIHYRSLGVARRNASGDIINAVMLLHGTASTGQQFLLPETADFLFGVGQPLDATHYYIILPDAIGHGGSSKPSDGLKTKFPAYTYSDTVQAQYRLLTETLGVKKLRLLLGTSMGGMHCWLWAERHADAVTAILPIACTPGPVKGRNLLWRRIMREAIRGDAHYHDGIYAQQPPALGVAWNVFKLMTGSAVHLDQELGTIALTEAAIAQISQSALAEQDANDVLYEFAASRDYDPTATLSRITTPVIAVNFADDQLNPVELGALAAAIKQVSDGEAITIPAGPQSRGHNTLHVAELWAPYVKALLDKTAASCQ